MDICYINNDIKWHLLKDKIFPEDNVFPSTCREARQLLVELGVEYKQIHACQNDFILYRGDYQNKQECHVCKEKRYHTDVQSPTVPK